MRGGQQGNRPTRQEDPPARMQRLVGAPFGQYAEEELEEDYDRYRDEEVEEDEEEVDSEALYEYEHNMGMHDNMDSDDDDDYDGDYMDEMEEHLMQRYRQAIQRAMQGRGVDEGDGPGALPYPLHRLVDFLDQVRAAATGGNRMNAIGPFIPDEDFDESYEALLNLSERIGEVKQRGLSEGVVSRLPSSEWTESMLTPDCMSCAVCLEAYAGKETLMVLRACGHSFHWSCAGRWLVVRATCPICRVEVIPSE